MTSADDVAAAVIACVGTVDAWKLEKLVYYSQAWHLAITDEPLFEEPIEAWRDGPVVDRLFQQHRGQYTVSSWPSGQPRLVSARGRRVISKVCSVYGQLSGAELSDKTHSEEPWKAARRGLPPYARGRTPIEHSSMAAFYRRKRLGGQTAADIAAGGMPPVPEDVEALSSDELRNAIQELRHEFVKPPEHEPTRSSTTSANRGAPVRSPSSKVISVRSRRRR